MAEREAFNTVSDRGSAVYERGGWVREDRDPETGHWSASGYMKTRAGIVLIHIATFTRRGVGPLQWISFEAVVNGRSHFRSEHRTRSRFVTRRGAMKMAGRWIRRIAGGRR